MYPRKQFKIKVYNYTFSFFQEHNWYSKGDEKVREKIAKLIRILCLPLLIKQEEQPKCKYCANIVQILCKYCTNIIQIFFESNRAIQEHKRLNRAKC